MRLAHRLVLGSSAVVALVMTIYGVTTLRQRERLMGDALVRETEALAHAMQIVANSAVRNGQTASLDRVLGRVLRDPDTAIGAVLDPSGRLIAGGPADSLACIDTLAARAGQLSEMHVWADCGGRVRLVVLPLQRPAEALVIARRTTVVDRITAASRRDIALTGLALAVLGSLAILAVVRLWLTGPLDRIMAGLRGLGGPALPHAVEVPRGAHELRRLALAFNEMVERLEGKQHTLLREAEERIALERRLRETEVFAAVGRLTGGVAHELGSPLGVIGVRAEAIQASPDAPADVKRHAEAIGAEVERIARLVRDLVHVARRHGPADATVDLGAVAVSVADGLRRDADAAGIELRVSLPEPPVSVRGDAMLLRHALYGVALNAVQAMRGHSGERTLAMSVERVGDDARVVVEDTGPGIATDLLPRVFEPFFTTKDVGEGTGLGLAIGAGIAAEHGGRLTLDAAPGGGVRACLELPVAGPAAHPRAG
ncbi:MAG TPA: HAMP domain-containing sensor histidine kinase [Longimicrobium sp.]|nr:HAMP domain-containing sensor histidine kinase [Longimicrobium sp.]